MSVRIGFIGTGRVAQRHLENLNDNPDAELVAYCDIELAKAEHAAEQYGGNSYRDFEKMLDHEELDGVVICTPPFAHGDIEMAACEKGLHLLIEKPVALSTAVALPILEAIESAGVISLVAYKYRWDDHVHKGREMLEGRTIGLVFGNVWGSTPSAPWWRVKSQSGGPAVEQTTHIFDMARFMAGEITRVQAFGTLQIMDTVYPDFDVWDACTANLEFANGAVGTISSTCLSQNWRQSTLRVLAHELMVNIAGDSLSWAGEDGEGEYAKQVDGYVRESEAFVEAMVTGDRSQIHSDYGDAIKTLAVSEATNRSIENGGEVVEMAELLA